MPGSEKNCPSTSPARLVGAGLGASGIRSALWGAAGTLILHALLLWLAPERLPAWTGTDRAESEDYFEIVLAEPEEPSSLEEFVMTNPEVPANPPDETRFFSDRNQQAAQEVESEAGDPSMPDVEGELPDPTQNIVEREEAMAASMEEWMESMREVNGDLSSLTEPLPETLIPGFEPVEEGEGLDVPVTAETDVEPTEEPVFGVELGEGESEEDSMEVAQVDSRSQSQQRVTPRPRPRLPLAASGPTGTRRGAAPNLGTIAVSANFSEFGDYLARMLEVIVEQWHILAWEALPSGEVGTVVSLSFQVDSSGRIREMNVVNSTASLTATLICQDAVSARQPYGEWPPDMKEVLGEEQTIEIRFHYR